MALMLGGASFAAFVLIHPFGTVVGSVATQGRWVIAHSFHFTGALLTLFGLVGLYARVHADAGALGLWAFLIAFAGMATFVGTGMSTAFLWPIIAQEAPAFVGEGGAMFSSPMPRFMTAAPYVLLAAGLSLLGIAMLRARSFHRVACWFLIVGTLLFLIPVHPFGPFPWIVRVIGGVVFGASLTWIGFELRKAGVTHSSAA